MHFNEAQNMQKTWHIFREIQMNRKKMGEKMNDFFEIPVTFLLRGATDLRWRTGSMPFREWQRKTAVASAGNCT